MCVVRKLCSAVLWVLSFLSVYQCNETFSLVRFHTDLQPVYFRTGQQCQVKKHRPREHILKFAANKMLEKLAGIVQVMY